MARRASSGCSRSSVSRALPLLCALALSAAPHAARACAAEELDVAGETTFDPHVLGDASIEGAFYDPYSDSYGPSCWKCPREELIEDWAGYLPGVRREDWAKVLFDADLPTIDGLIFFLQGKRPAPPAPFERSSLAALPRDARERVAGALFLVGFARRVEPFAEGRAADAWDDVPRRGSARRPRPAGDPAALQRDGDRALARATDPFLRQRYAFLLLRLRFHRGDWPDAIAFHRASSAALEGPSASLAWRARYYLAGAYWRSKRFGEANLELARIHAGFPALAAETLRDFHPMEERDWQASLALATTPREKAELWGMVGITRDGVAAMPAIAALEPSSPLVGLLAVREVNRLEYRQQPMQALERVALKLADMPRIDRPWLLDLVAGHVAALRGDLPAARARLARAGRRMPASNALAHGQARATLALALARAWRPGDAATAEELARAVAEARALSGRKSADRTSQIATARQSVRSALGATCRKAGLKVDAELLVPTPPPAPWAPPSGAPSPWQDVAFVEALLARVTGPRTPFERFVVEDFGSTRERLELELAQLHLVRGELAASSAILASLGGAPRLGTDPFVLHVVDCHDCDHERYAKAPGTIRTFVAKLAELERAAGGRGEPAAKAAFALGAGFYNIAYAGNARVVLAGSHAATADTRAAEAWFRRAYELSADRELKARAATMAAKCELARDAGMDVSKTWYPVLKTLSDTAYHREVLKECGWYREWAQAR